MHAGSCTHGIPSLDHTRVPVYGHQHAGNQLSLTDMCVSEADSNYLCSYTYYRGDMQSSVTVVTLPTPQTPAPRGMTPRVRFILSCTPANGCRSFHFLPTSGITEVSHVPRARHPL